MDDDDEIYGRIWVSQLDLTTDYFKEPAIPKPPPRNESLKPHLSETDFPNNMEELSVKLYSDGLSQSCLSFEGESVENLDIDFPIFEQTIEEKSPIENVIPPPLSTSKIDVVPFPKMPCFSELDDRTSLVYFGQIMQIVQKLTTSRKDRYGVLLSDRFVLFKKPEHKVSKVQIPIQRIINIYWYSNTNCATKNDCNKFKIDTSVRSYKFQCSSHENAGLWINHIGKLLIERSGRGFVTEPPTHILKASVTIEKVKGKRVFTIEPQYTLAYYECEDDFCHDIAMHRIQLRSSGVRRDPNDDTELDLITSYRKYRLSFDSTDICSEWFTTLSTIIHKAISSTTVSRSVKTGDTVMAEIYSNISNRHCADCGADNPEWASINLCVTLCNHCSGHHRGLGRSISSIQGILTDESTWQDANIVKLFLLIGNQNANEFFLSTKATINNVSDRRFVCDKYVRKSFIGRRDLIFDKYNDQDALNNELMRVVRTENVMRTMKLYHIGADINYVDPHSKLTVFVCAEQSGQHLQQTFLKNQSKNNVRDWRNELFDRDENLDSESKKQSLMLLCAINCEKRELRTLLISGNYFKILTNDGTNRELCKILYENVCLVREKTHTTTGQLYLSVVVRETEFTIGNSDCDQTIKIIELYSCNMDQSTDVRDLKNVLGSKICPTFQPTKSFDCIGWIILSTPTDAWKSYLSVLNSNRYLDFHDPRETNNNTLSLQIDIRKIQKIEELRDNSYESSCPYKMYNLVSICLISSVIYHIRSDTKLSHEEHLEAFKESWNKRDFGLSNQFLTKDNVPLAVHKMIQFLQLHVSKTEGPFRRVGSVKEAEKIYNELVRDPGSFMLKDCMAHDVASALKLFFRKLEDPLLTKRLFKRWIAAVEIKDHEEQLEYYKDVIKQLPAVNYQTLRLLIFLLIEIIEHGSVTQMDASNLSTSFNTCLLISGSQDPSFSHTNLQVLPFLLDNYKYLFDVSREELEREEMIRKGLEQISNDKLPTESTLLRQIYIVAELENNLKSDLNFEKERSNQKSEIHGDVYTKQIVIKQSMTTELLKPNIFNYDSDNSVATLFEERNIDDFLMQRVIYTQENVFSVITFSETFEPKSPRRWIFKLTQKSYSPQDLEKRFNTFKGWGFFSPTNKNKVYIELNETGQLNFWKNDQALELLANFSVKSILLYRSCKDSKLLVAFKDKKATASTLSSTFPKLFENFLFKSKSSYHYINFLAQPDYQDFLECYDIIKIEELIPIEKRYGMPKCIF